MRVNSLFSAAALAGAASSQFTGITNTATVGGLDSNTSILGNYYNYWVKTEDGVWDLTRSDRQTVNKTYIIPCHGQRQSMKIDPARSALVIIDMQNFFLYPELSPKATGGRAAVNTTVDLVKAFRKAGMKTLWTNWGLDDFDFLTMPPALLDGFSTNNSASTSFGSDMGIVPGTNISAGAKLMRNSWNAALYGPLDPLAKEGIENGTDLWFHKNRLSGLWGAQTPLGLYLQENQITTLFFGGVNGDQCVWSTFIDAFFKGYDVVWVEDIIATTSPYYATQMTVYNADGDGFLANTTEIIPAITGAE